MNNLFTTTFHENDENMDSSIPLMGEERMEESPMDSSAFQYMEKTMGML